MTLQIGTKWFGSTSISQGELPFYGWLCDKSTLDRRLGWGIISDASCNFCKDGSLESHNHLFFECSFSKAVWVFSLRDPLIWNGEKAWFVQHSELSKGFRKSILKLSLAAATNNI